MKFKAKKFRSLWVEKGKSRLAVSLWTWKGNNSKCIRADTEELRQVVHRWEERNKMSSSSKGPDGRCLKVNWWVWPLTVYEIAMSHVEYIEERNSVHLHKWLSVPHNLSTIALYSSQTKVSLPIKSLAEEFNVANSKLYITLKHKDIVGATQVDRRWTGHCEMICWPSTTDRQKTDLVASEVQRGDRVTCDWSSRPSLAMCLD